MFGGYTSIQWEGSNTYKSDPNAFIFSMKLKKKLELIDPETPKAILDFAYYGPSFGVDDIMVKDNSNTKTINSIRNNYLGPNGETDRGWAKYLGGDYTYSLVEIEVYVLV